MTDPRPADDAPLLERLRAHRALSGAPVAELEWLIKHGTIERYGAGQTIVRKGEPVPRFVIVLKGRMSHLTDHTGTWRKVLEWGEGDVTGQLPYSRMTVSPGKTVVEEPSEVLSIPRSDLPSLVMECPRVTESLVHLMLDRARTFKSSDLQQEKMASLGKLAAGLAHELNNPASAAARSAQVLGQSLEESEKASRALAGVRWTETELSTLDRVRTICLDPRSANVLSPLERADRQDQIADWLASHGADDALSEALTDTGVQLATLDQLAQALTGDRLNVALRWLAAGCAMRLLAREIERAASRMHALVTAVKGFTYMDQATAPAPLDLAKGLSDTVTMLSWKAQAKAASVTLEVPQNLPQVRGVGGELNQVWVNLLDNAIDAIGDGGHVTVTATSDERSVKVRVVDDGPGIPPDVLSRIFDPFFTTKPVGKGTGLGLDMARRLADSNGASIDVESVPGRTEFRVTLPVV